MRDIRTLFPVDRPDALVSFEELPSKPAAKAIEKPLPKSVRGESFGKLRKGSVEP
jgi:hypothetical protein